MEIALCGALMQRKQVLTTDCYVAAELHDLWGQ